MPHVAIKTKRSRVFNTEMRYRSGIHRREGCAVRIIMTMDTGDEGAWGGKFISVFEFWTETKLFNRTRHNHFVQQLYFIFNQKCISFFGRVFSMLR